jgi:hypothetical protein
MKQKPSRPGGAPVKPECVLVQIVVELPSPYRALVCSKQPTLEQRGNAVRTGEHNVCRLRVSGKHSPLVNVAVLGQSMIALPAISDHRRARGNYITYESDQAWAGDVGDLAQTDSAEAFRRVYFDCDDHNGFGFGFTSMYSLFLSPNVRLVNLDAATQQVSARTNHGTAELMEPGPRRLITAQAKHTLQTKRTHAGFLVRDVPHG